ncbi:hypothetical protein NQZ68_025178 [Dissostichus eleginoides]|nr:hypothetical protein NQZ68_025178 [Dissostichus eleginoides]
MSAASCSFSTVSKTCFHNPVYLYAPLLLGAAILKYHADSINFILEQVKRDCVHKMDVEDSMVAMYRVPVLPQDNQTGRRVSARQRRPAVCRQCPCCRDDQVPHTKRRRPAASADLPQKRKPTSAALPPKPADLPPVSNVAPGPQTSTAPLHLDNPIRIHNRSVEEYQLIYHEVVDNMLRFPNGRLRPYSLGLGRRIKQKLWERLDRPMFTETVDEDGLVHVDVSYGAGVQPPLFNVDVSASASTATVITCQNTCSTLQPPPVTSTRQNISLELQPLMAKPPSTAFASAPVPIPLEVNCNPSPPTASVSNLQLLPPPADSFSHLKTTTPPEDPHRKLWSNLHLQPL